MTSKVHAVTEVVGSSDTSVADAIRTAIKTASATLRHLEWFEVSEIRGAIKDGDVSDFQVTLKLGFRYEK